MFFKNVYALYSLNGKLLVLFSLHTHIAVHMKYLGAGQILDAKFLFLGCLGHAT